jgi:3-mercaptopyruvate sulfurtransferase SseA
MATREQEMVLQKQWFRAKLAAEKQKADVVKKVKGGAASGQDFVLLDARDRGSYAKEHIPGALPMPLDEVERLAGTLDPQKEYVTYCGSST